MEARIAGVSTSLSMKRRIRAIGVVVLGAVMLTAALLWGVRSSIPTWVDPSAPILSSMNGAAAVSPSVLASPQEIPPQELDPSNVPVVSPFVDTVSQQDVADAAHGNALASTDPAEVEGVQRVANAMEQEIVAIVAGDVITLQDVQEAGAIDAAMAGLAGVEKASTQAIVEQLIHTAIVLRWSEVAVDSLQAANALEQFLRMHRRSRAELEAALLAQGVAWERFERYFARLIAADTYLRSQQAATGTASEALLQSWRRQTPISFGPAAPTVLSVAAASMSQPESALQVETAAPVAEEPLDSSSEVRGIENGHLAPDFRLPSLQGNAWMTLQDLKGRPTVLSFWTTWCPYCLRQTPVMVEAHRRWESLGVQFVGINVRETSEPVNAYVTQHGIAYPVLLDADGVTATDYAIQGFPTTYFLDANLRIVMRHIGALTPEQLENYLQAFQPAK